MADFALEETMDAEFDRFLYRTGGMSDNDAFEKGIIDERGAYNHRPFYSRAYGHGGSGDKYATCKYCKAPGLIWKQVNGTWRLASPEGEIHSCRNYSLVKAIQELD